MTQKRKWFDPEPQKHLEGVTLQGASGVSASGCKAFLDFCEELHERGRLSVKTYRLFSSLSRQPPAQRLSRNLGILLSRLASSAVVSVLDGGINENEYKALVEVQKLTSDWEMRAIAQGLFNLHERAQLLESAKDMFREERARPWKLPDE